MTLRIQVSNENGPSFERMLQRALAAQRAEAIGIAVAYVSVYGVRFLRTLKSKTQISSIRLIADTRDAVTHPQALRIALGEGWPVRTVHATHSFHPKLYLAGDSFDEEDRLIAPRLMAVGSNNLTRRGMNLNVECALVRTSPNPMVELSGVYRKLWSFGVDLNDGSLTEYEDYFARRNRERTPDDLDSLGVGDEPSSIEPTQRPTPSIDTSAATTAWAGLESSTGEYRYQIEFPRAAGEVLQNILANAGGGATIPVLCEDNVTRDMSYRFYPDNSMFRLNVPNDVPGVAEARALRTGVGVVDQITSGAAPIRFRIVLDPEDIRSIRRRSFALGTWGRTRIRLYGWH